MGHQGPANEELVRSLYEFLNAADFAGIRSLLAPDAVFEFHADGKVHSIRGLEEIAQFQQRLQRGYEAFRSTLTQVVADGDVVVASGLLMGTGRDGGEFCASFKHFWSIADGKIARGEFRDSAIPLDAIARGR